MVNMVKLVIRLEEKYFEDKLQVSEKLEWGDINFIL